MDNISLNGDDWKLTGWWRNQWRLLSSMELGDNTIPAVSEILASVPGAVQIDLMRAGLLKDPNYSLDSNHGEWVNNREWMYHKEFVIPPTGHGEKYILCFDGLDYHGEIYLNGVKLSDFSGMFIPVEIDITGKINLNGLNRLRILFYPSPEVDGQYGYSSRINILKSRFNYVWDWCPRIVPVGIWDNVFIKIYNFMRINDFFPKVHSDQISNGKIAAHVEIEADVSGEYEFIYTVTFNNEPVITTSFKERLAAARQKVMHEISLENIERWWPSGHGQQSLYQIEMSVRNKDGIVCDTASKRIGFRTIKFIQNDHAPLGALPYTLLLNDKRIFLKGINWVPISPFYGAVTSEDYRNYLQRFVDMNCNILRVWGGAILEKQDFYDLCDEMGLMVWQEFPQSSSGIDNTPSDDPEFLKELEKVAEVYILKKRHHACHIIWCGGNELMWEIWQPVDEKHVNIYMLKKLVEKLDPDKYFLPCSASGPVFVAKEEDFGKEIHHDVHGPWNYESEPDHYSFFNGDDALFRSETGSPGMTRMETLEKYRGEHTLWPPDERNPYWVHRGGGWIQLKQLTRHFGEWRDDGSEIEQYVKASRYLQAESLRYAVEATRRREPVSSGFIIWMGNEPFPNNSNTSLIEYDGTPKPAYYWVQNAFAPLHVSLKYNRMSYSAGDIFTGEIYVHNDSDRSSRLAVTVQIMDIKGDILLESIWETPSVNAVNFVGKVEWTVEPCENNLFFLKARLQDGIKLLDENTYLFTMDSKYPFHPLRNLPTCSIKIEKSVQNSSTISVTNDSNIAAVGVLLYSNSPEKFIRTNSNYLILMPGEGKMIEIYKNTCLQDEVITICLEMINGQNSIYDYCLSTERVDTLCSGSDSAQGAAIIGLSGMRR